MVFLLKILKEKIQKANEVVGQKQMQLKHILINMNKEEINDFFRFYKNLEKIAKNILEKFSKENLTREDIYDPRFEKIDFDESDEKTLVIKYYDGGYDCYDSDYIKIPFDIIINNNVDEYIENLKNERYQRKLKYQKEQAERLYKNELAEYERLKNKFEKNIE